MNLDEYKFKIYGKEWNNIEEFCNTIKSKYNNEKIESKLFILGLFAVIVQNNELRNVLLNSKNIKLDYNLENIKNCIQNFEGIYDLKSISNFSKEVVKNIIELNDIIIISKINKINIISPSDIVLFDICKDRSKNDINNKLREDILLILNEPKYKYLMNDKIYHNNWKDLKKKWNNTIKSLCNENYNIIVINKIAGRGYNHDFKLQYKLNNNIVKELNVEFKFNSSNLESLPQFLNLSEKIDILRGNLYAEFFYDYYLFDILKLYPSEFKNIFIDKKDYLKFVYNSNYNVHPIFKKLKDFEIKNSGFKKEKNDIVNKSIKFFLEKYAAKIDIDKLFLKLKNTQDKIFLLWDCKNKNFNTDLIDIKNSIKYCGIKNDNTIVIKMDSNTYFDLLLRWKNHKGILFPAWQIKKTTDNKGLCKNI
jgi:hypothetical protein